MYKTINQNKHNEYDTTTIPTAARSASMLSRPTLLLCYRGPLCFYATAARSASMLSRPALLLCYCGPICFHAAAA